MLSIIIILSSFLINSVRTKSNIELNISVELSENDTVILLYNLTSNYSYFITFRSFGNTPLKFGLFPSTKNFEQHSIDMIYRYNTSEFIICFHFIIQLNDLNIQCKDLRLSQSDLNRSDNQEVFLPSYNPLFVPMMYALSVLMLLPVIIQNHRLKKAQSFRRRKEIKRLSVTISLDESNPKRNFAKRILTQIMANGEINYDKTPLDIELISAPSIPDDYVNATFTTNHLQPLIHQYDNDDMEINAHDCIAHLLDSTPWKRSSYSQPLGTSLSRYSVVPDSINAIKEQHVATIIPLFDERKSKKYSTDNYSRINRTFIETDV